MSKPDYGLDAPKLVRRFAVRGALFMAFAGFLYYSNRTTSPGAATAIAGMLLAVGITFAMIAVIMVWSSRVTKPKIIQRMLDSIPWRGDEQVLDVGCGRGLFLIAAAKRLKSGKATGVDIWRSEDLSGNTAEAAMSNAKAEGVANRIKIENTDARKLPFGANSFNVVVSSLAIHNIDGGLERAKALREIARVLKPGGYLAILDIFHTGEYAKLLGQLGFSDVQLSPLTFLWCVPTRTLTARKPT
ncbi:MAG TPA: class I SAM-dependent methyltransferase [Bryobacteraceae bacterium]|jgi:SAM-dependent methyltransferase|nr:class I SAM-dependent methyltransferase [Bryobacteraceae bacterium]